MHSNTLQQMWLPSLFAKLVLLSAISLLHGCGDPLPLGQILVSKGATTIVLSQQDGRNDVWTVYEDGRYMVGTRVVLHNGGIDKGNLLYELRVEGNSIEGLPERFHLQAQPRMMWFPTSVVLSCVACPESRKIWSLVDTSDPFRWFK